MHKIYYAICISSLLAIELSVQETGRSSLDAEHSDEKVTIPLCLDNNTTLPQYEYSSAERSPIGSLWALPILSEAEQWIAQACPVSS